MLMSASAIQAVCVKWGTEPRVGKSTKQRIYNTVLLNLLWIKILMFLCNALLKQGKTVHIAILWRTEKHNISDNFPLTAYLTYFSGF